MENLSPIDQNYEGYTYFKWNMYNRRGIAKFSLKSICHVSGWYNKEVWSRILLFRDFLFPLNEFLLPVLFPKPEDNCTALDDLVHDTCPLVGKSKLVPNVK